MLLDKFDEMEKNDYIFICFRRELLNDTLHNAYNFIPVIFPDWGDYNRSALMARILDHVRNNFDNSFSIDSPREFRMGLVNHPEYDTERLESEREYYSKTLVLNYLLDTLAAVQSSLQTGDGVEDIARIFRISISSVKAVAAQSGNDDSSEI